LSTLGEDTDYADEVDDAALNRIEDWLVAQISKKEPVPI
jgi:hypothetical protein